MAGFVIERIVASLNDDIKEAIVQRRIGNVSDLENMLEEEKEGIILTHALETLRFCRKDVGDSVVVTAAMVAKRLNENPFFFFGTQNSTERSGYADDNLWRSRCFPCHPVAG